MTIIPTMRYRDARAAIDWLCDAFGFEKKLVVDGPGGMVPHAQLTLGNGMIMLGSARDDAFGELIKPPADVGPVGTQAPYIVIADVPGHFERAKRAGAEVVVELEQQEDRGAFYACKDPEGHVWCFGEYDPWAGG